VRMLELDNIALADYLTIITARVRQRALSI
jgi:hypothetical protein